jgi:hypothetical protein
MRSMLPDRQARWRAVSLSALPWNTKRKSSGGGGLVPPIGAPRQSEKGTESRTDWDCSANRELNIHFFVPPIREGDWVRNDWACSTNRELNANFFVPPIRGGDWVWNWWGLSHQKGAEHSFFCSANKRRGLSLELNGPVPPIGSWTFLFLSRQSEKGTESRTDWACFTNRELNIHYFVPPIRRGDWVWNWLGLFHQ